jgi:hypothetical protein
MKPEAEQKLANDTPMLLAWRRWHREELNAALIGPHGAMLERLVSILNELELDSAPRLLSYVRGIDWSTVDYLVRLIALHEINITIVKLRERYGLAPFDDSLPWTDERPTAFEIVRGVVTGYEND